MGGFSFSSSPFFLYTDLNVKCSLIMTTTVEISQTDSGGMNLDLCFASQCIYALPLSVQRRPVELYDISVHTGQLCPFSLSVFFFLWLFLPPLCHAHWWERIKIIQDLVRYGLL